MALRKKLVALLTAVVVALSLTFSGAAWATDTTGGGGPGIPGGGGVDGDHGDKDKKDKKEKKNKKDKDGGPGPTPLTGRAANRTPRGPGSNAPALALLLALIHKVRGRGILGSSLPTPAWQV
jgi:hypothetical protein